MEKRIRESAHGGYVVEFGKPVQEQENPCGIGYIMPSFIVYKLARYDTLEQAQRAQYWEGRA